MPSEVGIIDANESIGSLPSCSSNQLSKNPNKIPILSVLPVFDVDVCPLCAVGVDDVAALDEEAVLRALHVRHLLQRGG